MQSVATKPPMSNNGNNTDKVPPAKEPAATPLVSAEQLTLTDYPLIHIPENKVYALGEVARNLAEQWSGTPEDHLTGKIGEYSVAKPLGIEKSINTDVIPDGGDDGVDLNYRGATIDVKTVGRHRSNPALTVDVYKPLHADYYVLASRISKTDVRLIGYVPRQFVANAPTRHHNGEPYHFVDQRYLFPFPSGFI